MSLKISKTLSLPDEAVTQTFAILAKRGVGKTYTASVMVEEMLKAHLPVVVLDPIGVWWGLRSSSNGKGAGLPITIAGGDHADVPIRPENGELLANLVVDQKLSMVIDLSLFRKGEQTRFVQDFAETLYHRNRTALHVVLDEADAFAPQRPMKGQERMLGAIEDLVRRGRARGLGVTMITQRPAVLNKDVLTQVEVLVAMRLISPQDRSAINEWVKVHGEEGQAAELMESLPSLPIGTAWFWSPGWLDIFQRVQVRKRDTLDSSSTPEVGGVKIEPSKMAVVDLDAIREKLAATIKQAEADDPKLLRRRIFELEQELAKKPEVKTEKIEVPVITDKQVKSITLSVESLQKIVDDFQKAARVVVPNYDHQRFGDRIKYNEHGELRELPKIVPLKSFGPNITNRTDSNLKPQVNGFRADKIIVDEYTDGPKITGGAQRMLDVLGARYPMTFTKTQLAALSKMSPRSGTFGTYMSTLRSNNLIIQDGDQISLTDAGRALVGANSAAPESTEQVVAMWRNNLNGGARRMFDALVEIYPRRLQRDELGDVAEISHTSGTFGTYLSMLKSNGLIEVGAPGIKASDSLFAMGGLS